MTEITLGMGWLYADSLPAYMAKKESKNLGASGNAILDYLVLADT